MIKSYVTGQKYAEFTGRESCRIDLDEGGLRVVLLYDHPSAQEIADTSAGHPGRVHIGEKNGVVFFFAKFGSSETIDMPFSMHLSRVDTLPDITPGHGLAMTVYLADCRTGELKNIRLIGLSEAFSRSVIDILKSDAARPFDPREYDRKLAEIYRCYTTRQLLAFASDSCKF